jgi:hypothetical protein
MDHRLLDQELIVVGMCLDDRARRILISHQAIDARPAQQDVALW